LPVEKEIELAKSVNMEMLKRAGVLPTEATKDGSLTMIGQQAILE
jgi:hypothetical protein